MTVSTSSAITVFVVDDHTLFRRGLMALIGQDAGLQVIGDASDASEALRQVPQLQPQVILLDNHLPGVLGVDAIAGLRQASPTSRVVMLTVSEDGQDLATALRNGAQGYLLKTMDGELLFEAIRRAARGEPVVSPELLGKLVTAFQSQGAPEPAAVAEGAQGTPAAAASPSPSPLSPREEEVLREIAQGASNKEIARRLDIAETTVKIHVQHILRKLQLSSRVHAAIYAASREAG